MYHRREARIGFVVTGGDAAELLDLAEEVFDQMAPLVHLEVARDGGDPIGFGRDHGGRTPIVQIGADPCPTLRGTAFRLDSGTAAPPPAWSCCGGSPGMRRRVRQDRPSGRQGSAGRSLFNSP